MKLFWKAWKMAACLVILVFVLCLGSEAVGASAEGSVKYDDTNKFFTVHGLGILSAHQKVLLSRQQLVCGENGLPGQKSTGQPLRQTAHRGSTAKLAYVKN